MSNLLQVQELHVAFGPKTVVEGVSLSIAPGEKLALVGESGSGKTVTALALLRLLHGARVTGQALFNDGRQTRDLLALPERELRGLRGDDIAMIFQEPMTALNPLMTVGEQIAEVIRLKRAVTSAESVQAAIELLAKTGIPEPERRAGAYPHQLSGGQRQRAMIAMALACQPKLIIADEPTTALDVTVQAQILALLKELTREANSAMILITHDLGVVARYADWVNVMYAGRIVESASVHDLFAAPQHPYTRGLLACLPGIARRNALLQGLLGKPVLKAIPGQVASPLAPPPGCAFAPRCESAKSGCDEQMPQLVATGPARLTRCLQYVEGAVA